MSAQSEQYFNSLTPQQQEAARATGAQPGGPNHNAWFAKAQGAGAVGAPNNPGGGGVGTPQGQPGGGGSGVTPAQVRASGQGQSEDYARYSDAELQDWISRWPYDPATGKFTNKYGDQVDKPDERGPNTPANMNGTGDQGNYGAGGAGGGGGFGGGGAGGGYGGGQSASGTYAGAPAFNYDDWKPPPYADATSDPGYQFALGEGMKAMSQSAAARGTQFTGGTMRDLIDYGQAAGAQQYQTVFDRSAQEYGINRDTARDKFAPEYGSWQTQYGGDLSKWTTRYQGNENRYLNRSNQIYGALNQPMPQYPGYY